MDASPHGAGMTTGDMIDETAEALGTVTIVVDHDHTVVRIGLRMLLDTEPGFEVVAEAGDVPAAVRSVRGRKPRVVVLDVNMPGESSLGAIPVFREISPSMSIVVLTMQNNPAFAREALRLGALALRPQGSRGRRACPSRAHGR